jgi:hypothetical protein
MKPVKQARLMGDNPLSSEAILEQFYRPPAADTPEPHRGLRSEPPTAEARYPPAAQARYPPAAEPRSKEKPTHYKVVCISLYTEDIQHLEALVAELKRRGHTKANKSQLIRAALAQVDLGKIPKGY